jgi:hypothetical protein
MALRFEGKSGTRLEVNSNNQVQASFPLDSDIAGFTAVASETDAGVYLGSRFVQELESTEDFRLRIGTDSMLFNETFDGTVLNSSLWMNQVTNMTTNVASGYVRLNDGGLTTAGSDMLRTYRHFPILGVFTTYAENTFGVETMPAANSVCEFGLGLADQSSTPNDGAFFRLTSTGILGVVNNNGTETLGSLVDATPFVGCFAHAIIGIGADSVTFWLNDIQIARIAATPSSQNLPWFGRTYNTGSSSPTLRLRLYEVNVTLGELRGAKPYGTMMSGMGSIVYQKPTGWTSPGSTQQWPNDTALPTSFALSNTSYAGQSALGGIYQAQVYNIALLLDLIVSSYLVPLGTAASPARGLYIKGVKINVTNTGAIGPALVQSWALGLTYGGTTQNMTTTDSATGRAARRVPLGIQSIPINAPINTVATPDISFDFGDAPLYVQPGEYLQLILKGLTVTGTSGQVLTFNLVYNGYWE